MTVNEMLQNSTVFTCLNPDALSNQNIKGVFIGDLLSWVMGNGDEGQLWVTVQGHLNVAAVAVLKEFSGIVLCHGAVCAPDCLVKATEENIPVIITELSAYECAQHFVQLGL